MTYVSSVSGFLHFDDEVEAGHPKSRAHTNPMRADEMLWRRLTFAWQNIGPCHSKLGFFAKNAKNFGPCGEPYGSLKVIISKKSENLQKFYNFWTKSGKIRSRELQKRRPAGSPRSQETKEPEAKGAKNCKEIRLPNTSEKNTKTKPSSPNSRTPWQNTN